MMDVAGVIEALGEWEGLPVDAIRAAEANGETMAPVFLHLVISLGCVKEQYVLNCTG
jgi:hypothetical protein